MNRMKLLCSTARRQIESVKKHLVLQADVNVFKALNFFFQRIWC